MATLAMLPRLKCENMSNLLAQNARLDANRLPADTDYSFMDEMKVRVQLNALNSFPPLTIEAVWLSFTAKHIATLVQVLNSLNPTTQPKARATLLQILALLPEPKHNPYLRRLLRSPHAAGLPALVARAFVADPAPTGAPARPGAPMIITSGVQQQQPTFADTARRCALLTNLLVWCDDVPDAALRGALAETLRGDGYAQLAGAQRVEVERLEGVLRAVGSELGTGYLVATREHLEGGIPGQEECDVCMEEAGSLCSACKSVRYCGQACQAKGWKSGHKYKCFAMAELE